MPVRAYEFIAVVPAITPGAPAWAHALVHAFTLDAVLTTSLYTACFVTALHRSAWFPRLLLLAWGVDLFMQATMAAWLGSFTTLPASLLHPLADILVGNVKKVAVSMTIWLPYLIVSPTFNLTFRHRVRA